jgi:hypothetical protein
MSAKQPTENKKSTSKETKFKEIELQLSAALPTLKESLGEKKFEKRVKKAAKILGEGTKSKEKKKLPAPELNVQKPKATKAKIASPGKKSPRTTPAK